MDLKKDEVQNLPEAPASVTARVVSDQGFHLLFTLRDTSVSGLITKFEEFQKHVLSRGWKPETYGKEFDKSNETKRTYVSHEIRVPKAKSEVKSAPAICATCGELATKKSGYRKDGTLWEGVFCSTGDESHKVWIK